MKNDKKYIRPDAYRCTADMLNDISENMETLKDLRATTEEIKAVCDLIGRLSESKISKHENLLTPEIIAPLLHELLTVISLHKSGQIYCRIKGESYAM